jgi:hypothetical protein
VETLEDLATVAGEVLPLATEVPMQKEKFLCWAPGSGEELWLKVNRRNQVFRVSAHYSGSSRVRVRLIEGIWPRNTGADDMFRAWTDPPDDSEDGVCQILFDCPDGSRYSGLSLPVIATAQIAAFAREIVLDHSPEDAAGPPPPPHSSAPPGAFVAGGSTEALFSGRVIESSMRTNSLTGNRYVWASAQTLGGLYDLVIHPIVLAEPPPPGAIVTGSFRLSGRLLDQPATERKGLLTRLFDSRA